MVVRWFFYKVTSVSSSSANIQFLSLAITYLLFSIYVFIFSLLSLGQTIWTAVVPSNHGMLHALFSNFISSHFCKLPILIQVLLTFYNSFFRPRKWFLMSTRPLLSSVIARSLSCILSFIYFMFLIDLLYLFYHNIFENLLL